jgi:hypothetical protein
MWSRENTPVLIMSVVSAASAGHNRPEKVAAGSNASLSCMTPGNRETFVRSLIESSGDPPPQRRQSPARRGAGNFGGVIRLQPNVGNGTAIASYEFIEKHNEEASRSS